jgi:hypothetical protein
MKYVYNFLSSITASFKNRILKLFKQAFNIKKFVISIKDVKKLFPQFDGRKTTHWHNLLDKCIEKLNIIESQQELQQNKGENNNDYFNRIQKLIQSEAAKYQIVIGRIDTFMGLSTNIYKRLNHPIKGWSDTKLGKLFITNGQVSIEFSVASQSMIVPNLQTAFQKFDARFTPNVAKCA